MTSLILFCRIKSIAPSPQTSSAVTTNGSWYYIHDGSPHGPHSAEDMQALLRGARITAATLIAREGWNIWKPLAEVPEVADLAKDVAREPPPPDPMNQITAVQASIRHVPAAARVRGQFRQSLIAVVLLLGALVAGFEIKWSARKAELETNQLPRAEQIVERQQGYVKEGLTPPRALREMDAHEWARLEPADLDRKEKQLESSWRQFNEGKRIVAEVDGCRREGANFPENITKLSASDWGLMEPDDFNHYKETAASICRESQKTKQKR